MSKTLNGPMAKQFVDAIVDAADKVGNGYLINNKDNKNDYNAQIEDVAKLQAIQASAGDGSKFDAEAVDKQMEELKAYMEARAEWDSHMHGVPGSDYTKAVGYFNEKFDPKVVEAYDNACKELSDYQIAAIKDPEAAKKGYSNAAYAKGDIDSKGYADRVGTMYSVDAQLTPDAEKPVLPVIPKVEPIEIGDPGFNPNGKKPKTLQPVEKIPGIDNLPTGGIGGTVIEIDDSEMPSSLDELTAEQQEEMRKHLEEYMQNENTQREIPLDPDFHKIGPGTSRDDIERAKNENNVIKPSSESGIVGPGTSKDYIPKNGYNQIVTHGGASASATNVPVTGISGEMPDGPGTCADPEINAEWHRRHANQSTKIVYSNEQSVNNVGAVTSSLEDTKPLEPKMGSVTSSLEDTKPLEPKMGSVTSSLEDTKPLEPKMGGVTSSLEDTKPLDAEQTKKRVDKLTAEGLNIAENTAADMTKDFMTK